MNTDRVVVITGAAGGMGTLFVECFLANGDTVIAIDNDEDAIGHLAGKAGIIKASCIGGRCLERG